MTTETFPPISRRDFLKQLSLTSLALVPAVQTLGELLDTEAGPKGQAGDFFIDAAYRLMHYQNMLELEFYFLNVCYSADKRALCPLTGSLQHYRSYMIVRLPQQHIAEQYVNAVHLHEQSNPETEALGRVPQSRIAGYSYLCFQINFEHIKIENVRPGELPLEAHQLMDWNAAHFTLIAKPDNRIKPFVYDLSRPADYDLSRPDDKTISDLRAPDIYPLGYQTQNTEQVENGVGGKRKLKRSRRRHYPNERNYPGGLRTNQDKHILQLREHAPFTALEIPYRLIVSPRLPSWEYDYAWVFTSFVGKPLADGETQDSELWMATLTIRKTDHNQAPRRHRSSTQPRSADTPTQSRGDAAETAETGDAEHINQAENLLQLMILGPAGNKEFRSGKISDGNGITAGDAPPQKMVDGVLPTAQDRLDLTRLSVSFNLPATTPALTFTPLGVCAHLTFRNKYFEKDRISLYEWKQAISFGRDQEVEVSNVVVDATFGLKMLHVRTTRRETTYGRAALIYREFLLPLEPEKDFASYDKSDLQASYQQPNGKYATPFQLVRFPDLSARQILPINLLGDPLCVRMTEAEKGAQDVEAGRQESIASIQKKAKENILNKGRSPYLEETKPVLAFWAVSPDRRLLEWPMEFTDWRGETRILRRRLYLLKSELNLNQIGNGEDQRAVYDYPETDDAASGRLLAERLNQLEVPTTDTELRPAYIQVQAQLQMAAERGRLAATVHLQKVLVGAKKTPYEISAHINAIWLTNAVGSEAAINGIINGLGLPTEARDAALKINKALLTEANPWQNIRRQTEEYTLHALDGVRDSLQGQLQSIETWLVAVSTRGERDVEDRVLEEWGRFKRRALTAQATLEAELEWLRQRLNDLVDRLAAPFPATLAAFKTALIGIQADLRRDYANWLAAIRSQRPVQELVAKAHNILKTHLQKLCDEFKGLNTTERKALEGVISDLTDWEESSRRRLDTAVAKAITELGHAYEQMELLLRLPAAIRTEAEGELRHLLDRVAAMHTHIQRTEEQLRSRIDAAKSRICYAVHQAEDELETLKRAVTAQLQQKLNRVVDQAEAIWQEEYEKYRADFAHAASGRLAEMRTDFLVFRGNLRLLERDVKDETEDAKRKGKQKILDFFNSYPCYPQLHTAQVYAEAIDDLARCEIPLKIKYAADYVENQLDNLSLEVKNNAARVFAEVHSEAQELLKGALREAGKDLGGLINPEVASQYLTLLKDGSARAQQTLDDLRTAGDELARDLQQQAGEVLKTGKRDLDNLLESYKNNPELQRYRGEFDRIRNGMLTLGREAKDALRAAEEDAKVQASAFFQGLEAKILGSIRLRDLLGADFNLPKLTRLPDRVTYQFLTKDFQPLDVKVFRFIPSEQTSLSAFLEIPTRQPDNFQSHTRLSDFTLGIFGDRLLVEFKHVELRSNKTQKNKVNVVLGKIGFGKELEFLAALTKGFTIPGTGLKVEPSVSEIAITYALPIPGISGGAFTFDNLKFVSGLTIPIPTGLGATNQPLAIKLGINSATDPFAIGVAIFGGMGHFQLETTPRYIRRVDAGLSFGGLFRINLVIASGQAYLQAGIRYIYQREETGESRMELYALITCGANVTVFGFIDVSVVFTMYLKYQKDSRGSSLYGVASVSYSVRIGFFRKSFTLTFSKRMAGTDSPPENRTVVATPPPRPALPPAPPASAAAPRSPEPGDPTSGTPTPAVAPLPVDQARVGNLEQALDRERRNMAAQQHRVDSVAWELDRARDPQQYETGRLGHLDDPDDQARRNREDRDAQLTTDQAISARTLDALIDAYRFEFETQGCIDTNFPLFVP